MKRRSDAREPERRCSVIGGDFSLGEIRLSDGLPIVGAPRRGAPYVEWVAVAPPDAAREPAEPHEALVLLSLRTGREVERVTVHVVQAVSCHPGGVLLCPETVTEAVHDQVADGAAPAPALARRAGSESSIKTRALDARSAMARALEKSYFVAQPAWDRFNPLGENRLLARVRYSLGRVPPAAPPALVPVTSLRRLAASDDSRTLAPRASLGHGCGELRVQLRLIFAPVPARDDAAGARARRARKLARTREKPVGLEVRVVEAMELKQADWLGKADPYVTLELVDGYQQQCDDAGGGAREQRTSVQAQTLAPYWNERFDLELRDKTLDLRNATLVLRVCDDDATTTPSRARRSRTKLTLPPFLSPPQGTTRTTSRPTT